MRASLLLSVCLLAASSAHAMQLAGPQETGLPRRRLERRVVPRRLGARAPLLSGGNGSNFGDGSNTGTGADSTATDSVSASISSSTSATTSSTTTSSSTRTTSSSTRTSFTSTTTSTPSTSSSQSSSSSASSVVMVTSTVAAEATPTAAAAAQTSSADASSGGGHTGLIVGVSVVGGIALIGALIFLYMKFGGRRFSDYQDDDADIKWPELKAEDNVAAMQPLPARSTGRAGFDMGDESDPGHEAGGDAHSMTEYGGKVHESAMGSTTALNAGVGAYGGSGAYGHNLDGYDDAGAYGAPQHHQQGGVTGYYDQYSTYGHSAAADGQRVFYPDQGAGHDYNAGGYGGGYGGGYDHNTSPPSDPYRVGGPGGY